MMGLVAEQSAFVDDILTLIAHIRGLGYQVTFGEALRPIEMQQLYMKTGRSKTMDSDHLRKLALDLNFFLNGKLVQDRETLKPIGDFWEKLHPKNRWGGSWRGLIDSHKSHFVDCPHFERHI